MNINYRTCHSIIEFINLLFEQEHLMGTSLETGAPLYKTEYSRLNAFRNDERCSQSRVEYIKVSEAQEVSVDENQYNMIARRMVQLKKNKTEIFDKEEGYWRPVEWRDMSVLMASRTNLTRLELALKELDIPYNVYGGLGFYDRQEVIDFLSLLRWLNRPYEQLYIMAVLRSPMFGLTMDEFLEIHHQHGVEWSLHEFLYEKRYLGRLSNELNEKLERFCALYERWTPFRWSASIQMDLLNLLEDSGLKNVLLLQKNNLMKVKNIEKLIETIVDLRAKSMEEMLAKIAILADLSEKEGDAEVELTGGNYVHIMTIHGSKGLEYPVVFVPNLSRALPADRGTFRFDIERGISVKFELEDEENLLGEKIKIAAPNFSDLMTEARNQAIEESKRLFYVALTRARDLLILTSKDKEQKESWFSWLELALINNEMINDYITVIDELP
ncbi:MAG: 3'-5' exonuclease, partial [Bacillus sp. (in: firmicutes)]